MSTEFIELAGKINQQMPYHCVERIERALNDADQAGQGLADPDPRRQLQGRRRRHPRVARAADHGGARRARRASSPTTIPTSPRFPISGSRACRSNTRWRTPTRSCSSPPTPASTTWRSPTTPVCSSICAGSRAASTPRTGYGCSGRDLRDRAPAGSSVGSSENCAGAAGSPANTRVRSAGMTARRRSRTAAARRRTACLARALAPAPSPHGPTIGDKEGAWSTRAFLP